MHCAAARFVEMIHHATLRRLATPAVALALAVNAVPARAQETREAELAARRADKAAALQPYTPTTLERRLEAVGTLLNPAESAFGLAMGSAFNGAGFAVGPAYRVRFGDTGAFDAKATMSVRRYSAADARLTLPRFGNDRVTVDLHGSWLDAPAVASYGLGSNTSRADRGDFAYRSVSAGVTGSFRVADGLVVSASLDGVRDSGSSVDEPLAIVSPSYRRTTARAQYDTRPSPGYARRGGLYRAEWSDFRQVDEGASSFRQVEAEVQRFVPVWRDNWVLAFRALATTTHAGAGESVPYFRLPSLGGVSTMRGFQNWRFRDRHRMLLTGEYRWAATSLMELALFVDAGKVAGRLSDLNLSRLQVTRGIGVRFHTPNATMARFEVARSAEGSTPAGFLA
jgi:outer membrane protein assembly factor BamA